MVPNQKTTALDSFVDPCAPICYGILKPGEHVSDGVPVIKVKNIIGGRILEGDLLRTSPQIHNQYKRAEVNQGDLLLTIRGTTGRVAIVPSSLSGANITQDTARIRVSSDDDPMYVFYALQSPSVQRQIDLNTVGQAVKGINIAEVRKLKIFHPASDEQKKISRIMSTWDKAITTTEQLLANSRQQKKALMQQLLTGKQRLLDKDGVRFSGEWQFTEIGDFLRESRTRSPTNDPSRRLTVRLNLKGVEVREFRGTEALDSTAHFVRSAGQFIYGKQNIHKGAFGIIPSSLNGFETSQDLPAFDFTGKCDSSWFFYYMAQERFFASLEDKMSGTGSKRLNPKVFFKIKINCPPFKEQQKIAAVLSTADREIDTLQRKLDALKQEKKALMQQLLTGKRRVTIDA